MKMAILVSKYTPKRINHNMFLKNAPNCTVNFFLKGACPRTPIAMRMASQMQIPQIWKKLLPPPPSQILGTPLCSIHVADQLVINCKQPRTMFKVW